MKILARNGATALTMAKALVKRLENSWSWDRAKSSMTLLEECAIIDEDLVQRIEAAEHTNSQVRDAWTVPDRIQSLVQRHRHIGATA